MFRGWLISLIGCINLCFFKLSILELASLLLFFSWNYLLFLSYERILIYYMPVNRKTFMHWLLYTLNLLKHLSFNVNVDWHAPVYYSRWLSFENSQATYFLYIVNTFYPWETLASFWLKTYLRLFVYFKYQHNFVRFQTSFN